MLLYFSNHKTKMLFEFSSKNQYYLCKHQEKFSENLLLDVGMGCLTTIFLCFYLQNKSHKRRCVKVLRTTNMGLCSRSLSPASYCIGRQSTIFNKPMMILSFLTVVHTTFRIFNSFLVSLIICPFYLKKTPCLYFLINLILPKVFFSYEMFLTISCICIHTLHSVLTFS